MGKRLDSIYNTWTNLEKAYQEKGNGKTRLEFIRALIPGANSGAEINSNGIKSLLEPELGSFTSEEIEKYNSLISAVDCAASALNNGTTEIDNLDSFLEIAEDLCYLEKENSNVIDFTKLDILIKDESYTGKEILNAGHFSSFVSESQAMNLRMMDEDLMYFRAKLNVSKFLITSEAYTQDDNSFITKVCNILYYLLFSKESVDNIAFISPDNFSMTGESLECYSKNFDIGEENIVDREFSYTNVLKTNVTANLSYVDVHESEEHPRLIFVR